MKRRSRNIIIGIIIIALFALTIFFIDYPLPNEKSKKDLGAPLGSRDNEGLMEITVTVPYVWTQITFKFLNVASGEELSDNFGIQILDIDHDNTITNNGHAQIKTTCLLSINIEDHSDIELKEIWWHDPFSLIGNIKTPSLEIYKKSSNEKILQSHEYKTEYGVIKFYIYEEDIISGEDIPQGKCIVNIQYVEENVGTYLRDIYGREVYVFTVDFINPEKQEFKFRSGSEDLLFEEPKNMKKDKGRMISGNTKNLDPQEERSIHRILEIEYSTKMGVIDETSRDFPTWLIFLIIGFIILCILKFFGNKLWKKLKNSNLWKKTKYNRKG